jgi:hypothetical protein
MWSNRIVVVPPAFDDGLGLAQGVEDLAVEEFVPQARIEALDIAILPRTARRNVGGSGTDGRDPVLDRPGDELRDIV